MDNLTLRFEIAKLLVLLLFDFDIIRAVSFRAPKFEEHFGMIVLPQSQENTIEKKKSFLYTPKFILDSFYLYGNIERVIGVCVVDIPFDEETTDFVISSFERIFLKLIIQLFY